MVPRVCAIPRYAPGGVDDSDADDGLGIAVAFWAIYWRHRKKRLQYEERQKQFGWPQRDSDPCFSLERAVSHQHIQRVRRRRCASAVQAIER